MRRDSGDGSVYLDRRSGRYVAQLDISGGLRPRRYQRSSHESKAAAKTALREMRAQREALVLGAGPTVEEWLEAWQQTRHVLDLAATTRDAYAQVVRSHIRPYLGAVRLKTLTAVRIDRWLDQLRVAKRTARTIVGARNVLRIALNYAVSVDVLAVNPVQKIRLRHGRTRKIHVLTAAQVQQLLDTSLPWLRTCLALMTLLGLRRGEALGLQWDDLDWAAPSLHVQRSVVTKVDRPGKPPGAGVKKTKTEAGDRTIPLPPLAVEFLIAHRRRAELEAMARQRKVAKWIFPSTDGGFLHPRNLNRAYYLALETAGLPFSPRLHDLRHTAATALLSLGTDENAVAAWLGHTDVRTTRSLYHHPDVDAQRQGAAALNRHWGAVLRVRDSA